MELTKEELIKIGRDMLKMISAYYLGTITTDKDDDETEYDRIVVMEELAKMCDETEIYFEDNGRVATDEIYNSAWDIANDIYEKAKKK